MPYKRARTYRRRPKRRKATTKRNSSAWLSTIAPRVKQKVYNFTRDIESNIDFARIQAGGAGPLGLYYTTDGGIAGSHSINLTDLPLATAEFPNLFKQYRIVAVKTYMYPSANAFTAGTGTNTQNNNVMCRMAPNETGVPIAAGNGAVDWNQLQAKKRFIVRPDRPIIFYQRLKQRVDTASDAVLAYSVTTPKFIDTDADQVEHWGMNLRFDPVDVTNAMALLNESFPKFKVIQKVYFQMKGVK